MKFDTTKVLTGFDGKDIKMLDKVENEGENADKEPFINVKVLATLRFCCGVALKRDFECDKKTTLEMKLDRYHLAKKFHDQDEIQLSAEQISMLKKRISLCFGIVIVGRCCEILDPVEA